MAALAQILLTLSIKQVLAEGAALGFFSKVRVQRSIILEERFPAAMAAPRGLVAVRFKGLEATVAWQLYLPTLGR